MLILCLAVTKIKLSKLAQVIFGCNIALIHCTLKTDAFNFLSGFIGRIWSKVNKLPPTQGYEVLEESQLCFMNFLIFLTTSLVLNIFSYYIFIHVLSNCIDIISACPKFPSPQKLLFFWVKTKNFSRSYTFYYI